MPKRLNAITLLELLIAIVLLTIIVLGITNIDFFSHFHVITTERRAKLENETSIALEHMTKEISKAIGDVNQLPVDIISTIGGDPAIKVWIDFSGNGMRDAYPTDRQIAYRFTTAAGAAPVSDRYQIWYYANCVDPNCDGVGSIGPEVIAYRITVFNRSITDNYVNVGIGACWNTTAPASPNNPCITMNASIKMPSVSTN